MLVRGLAVGKRAVIGFSCGWLGATTTLGVSREAGTIFVVSVTEKK